MGENERESSAELECAVLDDKKKRKLRTMAHPFIRCKVAQKQVVAIHTRFGQTCRFAFFSQRHPSSRPCCLAFIMQLGIYLLGCQWWTMVCAAFHYLSENKPHPDIHSCNNVLPVILLFFLISIRECMFTFCFRSFLYLGSSWSVLCTLRGFQSCSMHTHHCTTFNCLGAFLLP